MFGQREIFLKEKKMVQIGRANVWLLFFAFCENGCIQNVCTSYKLSVVSAVRDWSGDIHKGSQIALESGSHEGGVQDPFTIFMSLPVFGSGLSELPKSKKCLLFCVR